MDLERNYEYKKDRKQDAIEIHCASCGYVPASKGDLIYNNGLELYFCCNECLYRYIVRLPHGVRYDEI